MDRKMTIEAIESEIKTIQRCPDRNGYHHCSCKSVFKNSNAGTAAEQAARHVERFFSSDKVCPLSKILNRR